MKSITIVAEQVSDRALAIGLPTTGVISVVVDQTPGPETDNSLVASYRALRNPRRFRPNYRIDVVVEDGAVESVFDSVAIAYGAGLFSDAEMWVNADATASAAAAA